MTTDKELLDKMCATVAFHFDLLGCNGKCNRIHLCQKRCTKLINSLDAWREIWDCMSDEQLREHTHLLWDLIDDLYLVLRATPLHHLEAALRMLREWTKEMEG